VNRALAKSVPLPQQKALRSFSAFTKGKAIVSPAGHAILGSFAFTINKLKSVTKQ